MEILAGKKIDIISLSGGAIAVNADATVYSNSFPLPRTASFSVSLRAETGGATDIVVSLEQSNVRPTTEGSADTANYTVPVNSSGTSVGVIANVTDEIMNVINFSPVVTGYGRLKITGQGLNAASTILTLAELYYVD